MEKEKINNEDVIKESTFLKGEGLIWDKRNGSPFTGFEKLVEVVSNGYNYNFVVLGFQTEDEIAQKTTPTVAGTCRGKSELNKLSTMFNEMGFYCVCAKI